MLENKPYKVFVKTDDSGRIAAINSDAFLISLKGWIEIDSGFGDKYHHAQNNYLDSPLFDDRGIFLFKLVNGKPCRRTFEEVEADYKEPEAAATQEQRLAALEEAFISLLEGKTE